MSQRIYLFEFHRRSAEVAWEYDNISDTDKEKVANLDVVANFDFDDEFGNYNFYSIMSELEKIRYENILNKNMINYFCKDISQLVLDNDLDILQKIQKYKNESNKTFFEKFSKNVIQWLEQNLELDVILDMINKKGLDSLKDIHKNFLKNI